jgi:hypothetical protein
MDGLFEKLMSGAAVVGADIVLWGAKIKRP